MEFDDTAYVLAAIGLAAAGALAFAQAWSKKRASKRWAPPEPETGVSLLLMYVSAAYLMTNFVVAGSTSAVKLRVYVVVVCLLLAAHVVLLLVARSAAAAIDRGRQASREQLVPALDALKSTLERAGVTDSFTGPSDPRLQAVLDEEVSGSARLRAMSTRVEDLLGSRGGFVGQALTRRLVEGGVLTLVTSTHPTIQVPHTATVVISPVDIPEFWALETSQSVFLGVVDARGVVVRLAVNAQSASGNSSSAVIRVIDRAERESRAEARPSRVAVGRGPALYRDKILQLEARAERVDRVAKRIFVVFKGDATVQEIARQRYGEGSSYLDAYLQEHRERRETFGRALTRGLVCREVYSASELREYVINGRHGSSATLGRESIRETLANWKRAIEMQPNYHVAITDEPIPFRYEIVDGEHVVMHEAIGVHESERINAIFLAGASAADEFQREFDSLWDRVPRSRRETAGVLDWIGRELECHLQ